MKSIFLKTSDVFDTFRVVNPSNSNRGMKNLIIQFDVFLFIKNQFVNRKNYPLASIFKNLSSVTILNMLKPKITFSFVFSRVE